MGGAAIAKYVAQNPARLKADVALVSDTAMYAEGMPTLCIGLRGLIYMEVEATGAARDLHSGLYGGAAPNAVYGLIELLAKAAARPDASANILARLGLAYSIAGKRDLAIATNRKAIKKSPESLPAYQYLAQLYLQNNQAEEGIRVLDEASRHVKGDAGALIDLGSLRFYGALSALGSLFTLGALG